MRCYTKRETKITPEVYSMRQLATKYVSKNKIHCYIREKNFVKYLKGEAPIMNVSKMGYGQKNQFYLMLLDVSRGISVMDVTIMLCTYYGPIQISDLV